MHSFHYRRGHLACEEADLNRVAEQFSTPLYVYSRRTIIDHFQRLNDFPRHN
jgi:diaminopimelate decarboxylase